MARLVRKNEHLFELLVQEKTGDTANARFVRDFKTLADVLIQEMVRHDLGTLVRKKNGVNCVCGLWRNLRTLFCKDVK